jgi:hypothetical protein
VKDIIDQLGSQTVQMACEAELEVTEAVSEIKRTISLDELGSSHPAVSGDMFTTPVEAVALNEDRSMRGTALQDSPGKLIQRSFARKTQELIPIQGNRQNLVGDMMASSVRNKSRGYPVPTPGTLTPQSSVNNRWSPTIRRSTVYPEDPFSQRLIRDRGKLNLSQMAALTVCRP